MRFGSVGSSPRAGRAPRARRRPARRRQLEHLDAAIVEAQRLDPARLEARQVALRRARSPAQIASAIASPVERVRPVARRSAASDAASSGSRTRCAEREAAGRAPAARGLRSTCRRCATPPRTRARRRRSRRPGRRRDRAARAARRARPSRDGAGHGDRARPALLDRLERDRVRRRGPGRVEPVRCAVSPDDREAVAADPGRHRLGHAEHRRGGERCVGRVPAALEHAQPGAGGERLARRDHPVERDRRLATVCVPEGHCGDRRRRARTREPGEPGAPQDVGRPTRRARPRKCSSPVDHARPDRRGRARPARVLRGAPSTGPPAPRNGGPRRSSTLAP